MINNILNILKMLVAILPFLILCIASNKANLQKSERSKQFFMPIISLIYLIVIMVFIDKINNWLMDLINGIPKLFDKLASISWMPDILEKGLGGIANFFEAILNRLNLGFWIFFISNTVIIFVYLYLKKICVKIMAATVKRDSTLHTKIADRFYEYFPERNAFCLREKFVQVRGLLQVFYYSALVISVLLMLVSRYLYFNGWIVSIFYPVFGIILVGELFFYLDGNTRREYTGYILGEDEDAYRVVNYSMLRKFMRSVFGDKLLAENTSVNNALQYDVTTDEVLRELEKSEDPKVDSFATYMNALNKAGFKIDHNYLYSSLNMLNGKSVLFNDPFYNDLIPYAFYPMNRMLLSHQKVLVVLGRHSIEDDIVTWLENGIASVTNIPFMWNIGVLTAEEQELDIGIVTRSDVLNMALHNANAPFLEEVGFIVVIEPSKLLSTAQIGLNLLVKKCRSDEDKEIVFCMCDKNCDGLVDAMSHALMTNITEVSATSKHLGTSSYMCWEADEDYLHHRLLPNISRYLGMGTELSFAALKNQVSKTKWYGGEAFPVVDMRWIDRQYYYDLTKYAGLPTSQEAMDEHFIPTANFWSAEVEKNNYITVEDESNNMFEILRDFSTRTTEQGFINIISSEYLLKEYMADNASIFEADAKAIPCIVADYTRSNRNTILRLVLMMSTYPVSEKTLEKELSILGIKVFDLKKQLWHELYKCYSQVDSIASLPDDYDEAVNLTSGEAIILGEYEWRSDIIKISESFSLKNGKMETTYSISDRDFIKHCVRELRSAGYVSEDENGADCYLGAELSGHVYQKYLPGQFFTFGGKYYEMQYLTADGRVLVRRASDHINGRPSYRQIRSYVINGVRESEKIGSQQDVSGMKVVKEFADITVKTDGYYRMNKYNDFSGAKRVIFEGEKNGIPDRVYKNKEILRIELPELDGKLTDSIRYTVTVLFNEIFRTIFAENQAFISAITDDSFIDENTGDRPLTYKISGDGCEINKNAIYIIEDSQLDLGLTVAVERNLERILEIAQDYLAWHVQKLEDSLAPPPEPQPPIVFIDPEDEEEGGKKKKKGFFRRAIDTIKGWFKRKPKKKKGEKEEEPIEEEIIPEDTTVPEEPREETGKKKKPEKTEEEIIPEEEITGDTEKTEEPVTPEKPKKEKKGIFGWFKRKKKKAEGEEILIPEDDDSGTTETEEKTDNEGGDEGVTADTTETVEAPLNDEEYSQEEVTLQDSGLISAKKPYHERYYMLYGKECEASFIELSGALSYLTALGMGNNPLKKARDGKDIAAYVEATFKPGRPDARYCDFCGAEIYGVEYETLADGRDRCLACGRTAIKTGEEFRKIFEDVKRNMEAFYGIKINAGIKVEMVNSKTLHKRLGKAFLPTPNSDGRVLGVAISDKNGYSLLVENGSPRMASMLTMAHELTHIWQYLNWNDKAIRKKYGKDMRLEIYEGMAKWVEIQYAYLINEPAMAKREEIITSYRDDEYGHGFLRYRANYPFSLGTVITKPTPFMNVETPLDPEYCGAFVVKLPTDGINPGDLEGEGSGNKPKPIPRTPLKGTAERDPKNVSKYSYNHLNSDEQTLYSQMLNAVNSFTGEVIPTVSVTNEQAQRVAEYIHKDHPEIFWFRHGGTYYFDTATQIVNRIELTYCMTEAERNKRQEMINTAIQSFMASVTDNMSDYEAVLRIYESIIKLVDYDTIGLERQKNTTSAPDVPDDLRSIYGVFVNKKAVCAGYAKAMQYLLNLLGIECLYVVSDTHAWNIVKLEGDYYHMDVTWGDSSDTKKEKSQDSISYDCFLITDEEVARLESHKTDGSISLPVCNATKCNYHRRHGLYFDTFDDQKIKNVVTEYVKQGRTDVSFKFETDKIYKEAKKQLVENSKFRDAIQYASLKTGVKLDTGYRYSTRDDRLVLAFFMKKL